MKKIVLSLICLGFLSSVMAEDMGVVEAVVKVAETKIKEDGKTARKNRAKVTVEGGSKVHAEAKMEEDNLVVGAVGTVAIIGEEAEISDGSEVTASSEMGHNNKVFGTAGSVVMGAYK
jgi:hypothetical protein